MYHPTSYLLFVVELSIDSCSKYYAAIYSQLECPEYHLYHLFIITCSGCLVFRTANVMNTIVFCILWHFLAFLRPVLCCFAEILNFKKMLLER